MTESIVVFCLGIFCIIIGIFNMRGNISSLHRYHRHRVAPEDVLPLGRLVGLGTIIIGGSMSIYSIFFYIATVLELAILMLIASIVAIVGIIVGLILNLGAIIKYNKGLF